MADTKATISALRAITAAFVNRLLKPVAVLLVILFAGAYLLTVFLALSFSAWWWLLLLIFIPVTLVAVFLGFLLRLLLRTLTPRTLSPSERQQVGRFADKLVDIAERSQTPRFFIFFSVAKDAIRGRESSFLRGLIDDSKSVSSDFKHIQELFRT